MADYKEIHGEKIKVLSSDPLTVSSYTRTWSSGGNMVNGRSMLGSAGTQTAALGFGGYIGTSYNNPEGPPEVSIQSATEEYDGSSWVSGNNMNTSRYVLGSAGTQTAGLGFGGYDTAVTAATEEYDGSAWTAGGNLNTARQQLAGVGTQTSGLSFGGNIGNISPVPVEDVSAVTEEYDGTAWTAGGTMATPRRDLAGAGTQTAGLAFGGMTSYPNWLNETEEYDGTSWTAGGNLATTRAYLGGCGTQTSGLAFSGAYSDEFAFSVLKATEEYDGTSWTAGGNMGIARYDLGSAGTQASGLGFGGYNLWVNSAGGISQIATEEYNIIASINNPAGDFWYNSTDNNLKGVAYTVSYTGTWATGGNLGTARYVLAGAGTQTAGLAFGGYSPANEGQTNATEEYNGSAWTSGGSLNTARYRLAGAGTQTAGLGFGGYDNALVDKTAATEEYDGSAWTAGGNMATAREKLAGAGTQTAGLGFAGYVTYGNYPVAAEEYDGSAWTAGGSLNTSRRSPAGTGTQTAGLGFGGYGGGSGYLTSTELYDGSAWTSGGNLATAREQLAGCGTQTAGLAFGGHGDYIPGANATYSSVSSTEEYDGSAWTAGGSLIYAVTGLAGAGTQAAGLGFGGYSTGGAVGNTEEYSNPSTVVDVVTFNTSS